MELAKEHTTESLNKLVTHNLKFVVTVAKQYQGQGLTLEDLINEGNIGLMKAAERFDPDKGFKFISYAVWWIRQSIIAAIYSKGRSIRATVSYISTINKINKETSKFIEQHNREPSFEELSEILNIDEDKIIELKSRYSTITSLDTPVSNDTETSTLVDLIENEDIISPDDSISKSLNQERLKTILNSLPDREKTIIIEHFGLFGIYPKPFDEIGKKLGITGERVRQIKNNALKILKDKFGSELKTILS